MECAKYISNYIGPYKLANSLCFDLTRKKPDKLVTR